MNREIQFRAWVNGSGKPRMINWIDIDAIEWCNDKLWHHNGKYTLLGNLDIMQFTGLKDKNGEDIYEGDILHSIIRNEDPTLIKVVWHDGGFMYVNSSYEHRFYLYQALASRTEIVGNVYENPELINVKSHEKKTIYRNRHKKNEML